MRNVSIRDMQKVIMDIHLFADGFLCPDWARNILKAMADLLETIISTG